jgi:integrase
VTASGKPFSPAGFTNWFRDVCNEAGLYGFSAHGLRKASMTRFAEAGCTVHQIAAFSGHKTLSEVAHYTRSVEQAVLAREAMVKARTKLSKPVGEIVKKSKYSNENNVKI